MGNYLDKRLKFHTASRIAIETGESLAGAMNVDGHIVTTAKVWAAPVAEFPVNSTALKTSTDVIATTEDLVAVFTNNRTESDKITKTALHNGFIWRNSDYPAVELYDAVEMSTVTGSDGSESGAKFQAYEIKGADGLRVTDWVPPTAVIDAVTGCPVAGYSGIAEAVSGSTWTILQKSDKSNYAWALANGTWEFVYISGLLTFDPAYTPTSSTMGYTGVRYTGFKYIGKYLDASLEGLETKVTENIGGDLSALSTKVDQEIADRAAADGALDSKIAALYQNSDIDAKVEGLKKAISDTVAAEAETARDAEKALSDRLDIVEGEATVEGSIKKALADAKKYSDDSIAALGTPVNARGNWDAETYGPIAEYDANAEDSIVKKGDMFFVTEDVKYTDDKGVEATAQVVAEYIFKEVTVDGVASVVVERIGGEINPANFASVNYVKDQVKAEADRAKGEEARIEGLVTAEASRADAAEKANAAAVTAEETRAKGEEARIEGLVTAEASRADAAEKALDERLQTVEGITADVAGDIETAVKAEADRAKAEEARIEGLVTAEVSRATGAESTLDGKITENANAITAEETRAKAAEEANATAITKEAETARAAEEALAGRVKANEDDIAVLMGSEDGSVAKALADAKDYADTQVSTEKSRAEGVESGLDSRLTAAEGNISAMDAAYKAADSALDERLQTVEGVANAVAGLISTAVTAEETRAKAEEARIEGLVTAEASRADAAEKANAAAIAEEAETARAAEEALEDRLSTAESTLAKLDTVNARSNGVVEVSEAGTAVSYNFATTKLLKVSIAEGASAIINFANFTIGDSSLLYVIGDASQYTINGVEPISLMNGLVDSFKDACYRISRIDENEFLYEVLSFVEVEKEVVEG